MQSVTMEILYFTLPKMLVACGLHLCEPGGKGYGYDGFTLLTIQYNLIRYSGGCAPSYTVMATDARGRNMMIETAIFGLNPLLLTLLIRSGVRWAPGQLSMLRTESRLMAMLRGETVPDRADFVLMRQSKKLGMELTTAVVSHLTVALPNDIVLGQFADICSKTA